MRALMPPDLIEIIAASISELLTKHCVPEIEQLADGFVEFPDIAVRVIRKSEL